MVPSIWRAIFFGVSETRLIFKIQILHKLIGVSLTRSSFASMIHVTFSQQSVLREVEGMKRKKGNRIKKEGTATLEPERLH